MGIPHCLAIPSISYKNRFQYSVVPLTGVINKKAISLAANLSIASLKLYLSNPAASVPSLVLCKKSLWVNVIASAYTQT